MLFLLSLVFSMAVADAKPNSFQTVHAHHHLDSLLKSAVGITPEQKEVVEELIGMLDDGYLSVAKSGHNQDKDILQGSYKDVEDAHDSLQKLMPTLKDKDKEHDACRARQIQEDDEVDTCETEQADTGSTKDAKCAEAKSNGVMTAYIPAHMWPTMKCNLKTFRNEDNENCTKYVSYIDDLARGLFLGAETAWKRLDRACTNATNTHNEKKEECAQLAKTSEDTDSECTELEGEFKTAMCMYEQQAKKKCDALEQFNSDYATVMNQESERQDAFGKANLARCMLQKHAEFGEEKCLEDPAKNACQAESSYTDSIGDMSDVNSTRWSSCTVESLLLNTGKSYWGDSDNDGKREKSDDHLKLGADGSIYRQGAGQNLEYACSAQ